MGLLHLRSSQQELGAEDHLHHLTHLEHKQLVHLPRPELLRRVPDLVQDKSRVSLIAGGTVMVLHHQRAQDRQF